jgi:Leucine-rich repeat (LRR) protein
MDAENINSLPDELLIEISQHIDYLPSFVAFASSCKRIRELLCDFDYRGEIYDIFDTYDDYQDYEPESYLPPNIELHKYISVDISDTYIADFSVFSNLHSLYAYGPNIREFDLEYLGKLHTLKIACTGINDVSALGGLHTLLASSAKIDDVSELGELHTLDISYTPVRDVSMLGKLHTLDISCTAVEDVSALGGLHTLIAYDTEIKDVSMLGGLQMLDIRCTHVTDISAVKDVPKLLY